VYFSIQYSMLDFLCTNTKKYTALRGLSGLMLCSELNSASNPRYRYLRDTGISNKSALPGRLPRAR
jgi:hypothetical protein